MGWTSLISDLDRFSWTRKGGSGSVSQVEWAPGEGGRCGMIWTVDRERGSILAVHVRDEFGVGAAWSEP